MNRSLDPWSDASELARRLELPHCELYVVVAAEAWCARCRDLRPEFEAIASLSATHEIWLWLDLEDHAEFIGDFLPDSLPVLLEYRGNQFRSLTLIEEPAASLKACLARGGANCMLPPGTDDPGIRARLLSEDWAV